MVLRNAWGRELEKRAKNYEPGGQYHNPVNGLPDAQAQSILKGYASNVQRYRQQSVAIFATSPVEFYIQGLRVDSEIEISTLDVRNRYTNSDTVARYREYAAGATSAYDDPISAANDMANRCIGRIFVAAYDAQSAEVARSDIVAAKDVDEESDAPGPRRHHVDPDTGERCLVEVAVEAEPLATYIRHHLRIRNRCAFPIGVQVLERPQSEATPKPARGLRIPARGDEGDGVNSTHCLEHKGSLRPTGCADFAGWSEVVP